MNKTLATLIAISMIGVLCVTPGAMAETYNVTMQVQSYGKMTIAKIMDFGKMFKNDVKSMPIGNVHITGDSAYMNMTIFPINGSCSAEYELIGPPGSEYANGKELELNAKYNLSIDEEGEYYISITPTDIGEKILNATIEPNKYMNITRMED